MINYYQNTYNISIGHVGETTLHWAFYTHRKSWIKTLLPFFQDELLQKAFHMSVLDNLFLQTFPLFKQGKIEVFALENLNQTLELFLFNQHVLCSNESQIKQCSSFLSKSQIMKLIDLPIELSLGLIQCLELAAKEKSEQDKQVFYKKLSLKLSGPHYEGSSFKEARQSIAEKLAYFKTKTDETYKSPSINP